jgi:hypothetical protein
MVARTSGRLAAQAARADRGARILKPTTPMRLATPTGPLCRCCSGHRLGGRGPGLGIWGIGGVARCPVDLVRSRPTNGWLRL